MKVSSSAPPEDLTIRQGRLFPGLGARDCERSVFGARADARVGAAWPCVATADEMGAILRTRLRAPRALIGALALGVA